MVGLKEALGIIAILVGLISYIPYIKDIFQNKTKPHAYSWFVWGSLTGIAFFGQLVSGGGPGAWVTGFTAAVSFGIFYLALNRGEQEITRSDRWSLAGATIALGIWLITEDPLISIVLITIIDAFGFFPTFRKSYHKPHQETAFTFLLSAIKFGIALFALKQFTVVTYLYPLSLVVMNGAFVVMILVRRKHQPLEIDHGF